MKSKTFEKFAKQYMEEFSRGLKQVKIPQLERMWELLEGARRDGRRVYVIGNGGSAMNAMHIACDFSKGTAVRGQTRIKVSSPAAETALVTAYANDFSYEDIFSEQVETFVEAGDLLWALSASGNSPNIIKAVKAAKRRGAFTMGIFGFGGGRLKALVDFPVVISNKNYGHAEDVQTVIQHLISQYMKLALEGRARFSKSGKPGK